jgi:hypothetical protein
MIAFLTSCSVDAFLDMAPLFADLDVIEKMFVFHCFCHWLIVRIHSLVMTIKNETMPDAETIAGIQKFVYLIF